MEVRWVRQSVVNESRDMLEYAFPAGSSQRFTTAETQKLFYFVCNNGPSQNRLGVLLGNIVL
jgi:hypothetical protein